jgi:hypothetical protein
MDGKIALQTIESFKEIMSSEDFTGFLKSEDSEKLRAFPEVQTFIKGEKGEDEDEESEEEKTAREKKEKEEGGEEEEKPEMKKALEDVELAKSVLAEKEAALNLLKPPVETKPVTSEMLKALEDSINTKFKSVTTILQKAVGSNEEIVELKKSVDDVLGIVGKIAGMPLGTKAIKAGAAANFFEKAFGGESKDEDGKQILSVSLHKEEILKSLEDGMNKATDPELKKSYENSIMRYNGGGGTISREVAMDQLENFNVRLTK